MYLTKNGITVEVTHPADITRYKRLGYVEAIPPDTEPKEVKGLVKPTRGKKSDEKEGEA